MLCFMIFSIKKLENLLSQTWRCPTFHLITEFFLLSNVCVFMHHCQILVVMKKHKLNISTLHFKIPTVSRHYRALFLSPPNQAVIEIIVNYIVMNKEILPTLENPKNTEVV